MLAVLICLLLLLLIIIGAPIAYALLIAATLGLFLQMGEGPLLGFLQTSPYRTSASFLLTTIPMFLLMAEFLAGGRLTKDLFRAAHYWFGNLRAGLALATTAASAGMAALSGSSPAAAATMAAISVPEMRKYGYSDRLSLATVAAAGTLAVMIPPSIILILYGILTESSIGRLFVAGLIPGLMTAAGYVTLIMVWARVKPGIAPPLNQTFTRQEQLRSLKPVWPALLLIFLVLGGIYSGLVTATEAGALGALGALVIGVLVGGLRSKGIIEALKRTAKTTSMIFAIIIAASLFGYFLSSTRVSMELIQWVDSLGVSPVMVLVFILAIYLLLGAFLDPVSILILTLPFTFPIVIALGYDPIWFGIIATKMVEIGLVTPPVGINVFVTAGAVNAKLGDAFHGVALFVAVDLIIVAILVMNPGIVTFLPNLLF